jgi:hypothetical protein
MKFLKTVVAYPKTGKFKATYANGTTSENHPAACWFMGAQDSGLDVKQTRFQLTTQRQYTAPFEEDKLAMLDEIDRILKTFESNQNG